MVAALWRKSEKSKYILNTYSAVRRLVDWLVCRSEIISQISMALSVRLWLVGLSCGRSVTCLLRTEAAVKKKKI